MPTISVIVPVYKVEKYMHRCVDSILSQTFRDFELILVDDGSPDICGAICDAYAEADPRIRVIHQKNGGLSAARNTGIDWVFENSDSEWISFVDSDDYVHPEMLRILYEAAVRNDVRVSVCAYRETTGEPLEAPRDGAQLWSPRDLFARRNVNATVAWGKLYSKDCFSSIRYPAGKVHEDEYVTYRILFAEKEIAVSDAELYGYFINPQGITKRGWNPSRMDAFGALEAQIAFFEKNGYRDLAQYRLRGYAGNILGQMNAIRACCKGRARREMLGICRNKLRHLITGYRDIVRFDLFEHYGMYKDAYPLLRPLFWSIRQSRIFLGKAFRRMFGNSLADEIRNRRIHRKN